jgi:hypothetical protein
MLCLASSENLGPLAIHGLAWPPVNPTHNPPQAFAISGAKVMRLRKEAGTVPVHPRARSRQGVRRGAGPRLWRNGRQSLIPHCKRGASGRIRRADNYLASVTNRRSHLRRRI